MMASKLISICLWHKGWELFFCIWLSVVSTSIVKRFFFLRIALLLVLKIKWQNMSSSITGLFILIYWSIWQFLFQLYSFFLIQLCNEVVLVLQHCFWCQNCLGLMLSLEFQYRFQIKLSNSIKGKTCRNFRFLLALHWKYVIYTFKFV